MLKMGTELGIFIFPTVILRYASVQAFIRQKFFHNELYHYHFLIHLLTKVEGYMINIQKSTAFLYTNRELSERESKGKKKNLLTFTISPKRIKYQGIILTKEVKDLYFENCKHQ